MPKLLLEILDTQMQPLKDVQLRFREPSQADWRVVPAHFHENVQKYECEYPAGTYILHASSKDRSAEVKVTLSGDTYYDQILLGREGDRSLPMGRKRLPYSPNSLQLGVFWKGKPEEEETPKGNKMPATLARDFASKHGLDVLPMRKLSGKREMTVIEPASFTRKNAKMGIEQLKKALHSDESVLQAGAFLSDLGPDGLLLTGDVYIYFHEIPTEEQVAAVLEKYHLVWMGQDGYIPKLVIAQYAQFADEGFLDVLEGLDQDPLIEMVEPATPISIQNTAPVYPKDAYFPVQFHLHVCRIPDAWGELGAMQYGSPDIPIGVLDSGIETTGSGSTITHPEFNVSISGGTLTGTGLPAITDKKIYFSFDYFSGAINALSAGNDSSTISHGTSVAGVIGAASKARVVGPNTYYDGTVGVMPNARLMSAKFDGTFISINGFGYQMRHFASLEPFWVRAGFYPGATSFPKNFKNRGKQDEPLGLPAENPNGYLIGTGVDQDGPGAAIINISSATNIASLGDFLSIGLQAIMLLGRGRLGVLNFVSAGNGDAVFHSPEQTLGPQHCQMLVAASSLDHKGREIKAPYSSYGNEYDRMIDFCAPSANCGEGTLSQPAFKHVFTTERTDQVGLPDQQIQEFSLSGNHIQGDNTLLVAGSYAGSPGPIFGVIRKNDTEGELIYGTFTPATSIITLDPTFYTNGGITRNYSNGTKIRSLVSSSGQVATFGGTSAAAPVVSGIAGLILTAKSDLSWLDVRHILRETAVPIALRHRGVSTIGNILDWRQFANNGTSDNPGTYVTALPVVDTNQQLIRNQNVADAPIEAIVTAAGNALSLTSTQINVGPIASFKKRQALLLGWETVLDNVGVIPSGTLNIAVADASGFDAANASTKMIRIGRYVETVLSSVDGTDGKKINVVSTDGFKIGDKLRIGNVDKTITGFGTTSNSGVMGIGGSCSRIILDTALTAPNNVAGTLVKIHNDQTEIREIDSKAGNVLTLTAGLTNSYNSANPIIVELENTELRVITDITVSGGNYLLEIDKLEYAHPVPFRVTGGRIANYNLALGYGRVDAYKAVKAALAFDFDKRDLHIRNIAGDNGSAATVGLVHSPDIWTRTNNAVPANMVEDAETQHQGLKYDSVSISKFVGTGPDDMTVEGDFSGNDSANFEITIEPSTTDFSWVKKVSGAVVSGPTVVAVTAGSSQALMDGVSIKFATGVHAVGDKWILKADPKYIFIKVKNRGSEPSYPKAALPSSRDVNHVRFMLACKNSPNFTMDDYVLNNIQAASQTYWLNSGNEGTRLLNSPDNSFGNALQPGSSKVFALRWPAGATFLPPKNNFATTLAASTKKLFILGEVVPYDGPLHGDTPEGNNNLSYREILLSTTQVKTTGGAPMPNYIPVDEFGNVNNFPVEVEVRADSADFTTERVVLEFTRTSGTGVDIARFAYDGISWTATYPSGSTGWITFAAPIEPVNNVPAVGTAIRIRFDGTIETSKLASSVTVESKVFSSFAGHETAQVAGDKFSYPITSDSSAFPDPQGGGPEEAYPRSFAFAEMNQLTQPAGMGFGPISSTEFRITSSFTAAANTSAYAIVDGTVMVQEGGAPNLVNVVLKPLKQGLGGFTPVKYFIYRGLRRNDFIDSGNPAHVTPLNPSTNSEWIEEQYDIHQDLNGGGPFESKSIGFDPTNQPGGNLLDRYFFNPDPDKQLPFAKKGIQLGWFDTGAGVTGIDIVLEDGFFKPTLNYVRSGAFILDLATAPTLFEKKAMREDLLNFLDPAAYYGMHKRKKGYVQYVQGGTHKAKGDNIYTKILAPFLSKNTLYVDIRDEVGTSYNFSGHHPAAGVGNNIEIGISSGSLTAQTYQTQDWPLLIRSNTGSPFSTPDDVNELYLKMRPDHITKPILYLEHGELMNPDLLQREHFIEGTTLFSTGNPLTEELAFAHPNVHDGGAPNDKLNIAWVIKMHLSLQQDGSVGWNTIQGLLPTENMYDNRFGPVEMGEIWETGTDQVRWVAQQSRKYVDGSSANLGYASDNGVVFEGDVDPNANPGRVIFFANAVDTFLTDAESARSKGMNGGFSSKPTFFDELLEMKKLNLQMDVVDDGGSDIRTLQLAPVDETSPQPESMMMVGLDKAEFQTLKGLLSGFSSAFPQTLKLEQVSSSVDFRKYKVGVQGYDTSGLAQNAFPMSDIHVYTTDDTLCYSDAFSAAQPTPPYYTRTGEEYQGLVSRKPIIESILKVISATEIVIGGDWVDKISPKTQVEIADAVITANVGGPWGIVSRTYNPSTKQTTLKLSGASLTTHSSPDGTLKVADINMEDHFVSFDNMGTLGGYPEMDVLVSDFATDLASVADDEFAVTNLKAKIDLKPADALARARLMARDNNYANADDRIYYWARIKMIVALKSHAAMLRRTGTASYKEVIEYFEHKVRGIDAIDFTPAGALKKVLICGFDLYGVSENRYRNNPSGANALALHGKILKWGTTDWVYVQSVIFPNRYADFDGKNGIGIVEQAFKKCIDPSDPNHSANLLPDMVVTISQAFPGDFWIDRFAVRNRMVVRDNNGFKSSGFPSLPTGMEFYETTLEPDKFKRSSNINFPAEDLNTRTTIAKEEFNSYFNNVFIYELPGNNVGYYLGEVDMTLAGSNINDGYHFLKDGTDKVENYSPPSSFLMGVVPTEANLTADMQGFIGSGGSFFSNESFYRTARLRRDHNPGLPTGHLHIPMLVGPSDADNGNYPLPEHLDLGSQQNLILRIIDFLVDGNRP